MRGGRDACIRLASACDARCPLCVGTGPPRSVAPEAVTERGGDRLTIRGASAERDAILRTAGPWRELRIHTHAHAAFAFDARVRAVLVPLFSHVDVVHDRIVGHTGALASALSSMGRYGETGLRVDIEIPLLPRRLAHPLSILRRARAATDALRSVRFVLARGSLPRTLMPPRWSEGAAMLDEALSWCAQAGVEVGLTRDDAVPFCALRDHPRSLDKVFRFDPRRPREPASGCDREGPCTTCACASHCPGVADTYALAHGSADISPFTASPRALYDQRTTPRRVWTQSEKEAARSTDLLVLRPTVNCNQDCLFCSANETSTNVWTAPSTMYEQIARAARRGIERLSFGGGEPTLARDLSDYVAAARRLGIEEVELVTNGTLLDREARVAPLVDAGLTHAFVSLHAHDEELSRHLTQKEGDFERTVRAIERLSRAGVKTAINHVITVRNYRYLGAFVRFARRRFEGQVAISFAFITPQYKALENFELVPRMSDVRPFLHGALAEALAMGQPCWVGARQGLPPCQLGAFRAWSDIFEHAEAGLSEDAPQKIQGPGCERCAYADVCTGVWRDYAARFGLDELQPIERPRFGGRERVIVDDLKTEPWGTPPGSLEQIPDFLRDRDAEAAMATSGVPEFPERADVSRAPFAPRRTRPLRIALIGSSTRARRLARAIDAAEGLTLDAVVSPHAPDASADVFFGCRRWRDAETALEAMRPDALVVAADPSVQAELAQLGLARGLPVLIARPLSRRRDQREALTRVAGSSGALVAAYELLHADHLDAATEFSYRVGEFAPTTWSRRTLGPLLEDLLALALAQDPGAELASASASDATRPRQVRLRLEGADALWLTLDLDTGEPHLVSRCGEVTRRASIDATDALIDHFAEVASGRASPLLPVSLIERVAELAGEALDALARSGLVFGRPDEPRHVASAAFRRGDE